MKISRKLSAVAIVLAALVTSGCAPTISLEPAELANDPACAKVIVRLPDVLGDKDEFAKRTTNAQSTAAWGNPTSVILRCGLPQLPVSTLPCVTSSDVDWLVDESNKPSYVFTTYGRTPATEVIVDSSKISGVSALDSLAAAIKYVPEQKRCK